MNTIVIDSRGVHAVAEGKSQLWLWEDIEGAKLVHMRDANRVYVRRSIPRLQIQRRGVFYDGDQDNTDLLPVTSAPYVTVIDIVAAGVERWRVPPPTGGDQ